VTRGTDLRGSGRKGLTRAGGSTAAQIGRRGAMVVEQPRAPTRGSRELTASVRSLGRCQGVWRGTETAIHGDSTMA
jgi:hypothetical protein